MARTAPALLTGKPAKKPVVATSVAQSVPKTATKVATTNHKPRTDAARRSQARRRRQLARTVRRFESVLTQLPKPPFAVRTGWSVRQFGATAWHTSKLFSLALLLGVVVGISYLQTDLRWFVYRENVQIDGATYVSVDELYQAASIENWNIFWLRPQAIREQLSALPHVADARVNIDLPNQVVITVQEEQPVALWVTNAETLWLMPDGSALPVQNEQFAALPQIIDPEREAQAVTQPTRPAIDTGVLASALALMQKLPAIPQLRYNEDYGLNFNLPNSLTWVYWGDGHDLDAKFTNLAAAQALIQEGKVTPEIIDVRYERPYIR